jgi:predicted DNA-binding transcriptional regulator AlpA
MSRGAHRLLSVPRFALRRDEAAASLAVSTTKFAEWCADGRMPRGRKIDGVVLWDTQEVLEAWERLRDGSYSKNPFDGVVA